MLELPIVLIFFGLALIIGDKRVITIRGFDVKITPAPKVIKGITILGIMLLLAGLIVAIVRIINRYHLV